MSLRRSARLVPHATTTTSLQAASTDTATLTAPRKRKAGSSVTATTNKKVKSTLKDEAEAFPFKKPEGPITPARAKRAKPTKAQPLTPTPSLVNVLRGVPSPYSTGDIDDATPPPAFFNRPADPHITNATLVTPGGTQANAYPSDLADTDISPTKKQPNGHAASTPATTTTGTLLSKAQAHLVTTDARFGPLVAKHHCAIFSPSGLAEKIDPFRSLTSGICGQQVSGAAAKAIKNKFVALFNEGNEGVHVWPTAKQVAATKLERLRSAGLSQRKAEYIQGLAEKFVSGELSTEMLLRASDEEVMEKLIAVRGLGKWSVEMFACFGLKRMDILSTGDLGVQRGMAAWFGKDVAKLKAKGGGKWKYMSEQDMLDKSAPYAPYRSLFMWFMWRVADLDITVLAE